MSLGGSRIVTTTLSLLIMGSTYFEFCRYLTNFYKTFHLEIFKQMAFNVGVFC